MSIRRAASRSLAATAPLGPAEAITFSRSFARALSNCQRDNPRCDHRPGRGLFWGGTDQLSAFDPESPPRFSQREIRRLLQIAMVILLGAGIGLANRKRGAPLFLLLTVVLAVAAIYGFEDNPQARVLAFLLACGNGVVALQKLRCRRRDSPG